MCKASSRFEQCGIMQVGIFGWHFPFRVTQLRDARARGGKCCKETSEGQQVLKVAVGPADSDNAKLIAAIARHLERDGARIRFVIVPVDDPAQSAKALESADLAVIRSDIAIPQNGATVVILHNDIAVLAAPAGSTIIKVSDLFKKRVGLFPAMTANAALLDAILAEYEIAPETVQHIMLSGDDLATIGSQKGVDAILTVGPLRGRSIEIATVALASRARAPVLIPVDAAEGIAARGPEYQKADIPAGFFRGSPPQPKEDVATISIAVRLEARQNLSEEIVTGLTKRLFAMRRSLESEVPIAAAMGKPDTEKGSAEAVHPGAAAYYDNNEKTKRSLRPSCSRARYAPLARPFPSSRPRCGKLVSASLRNCFRHRSAALLRDLGIFLDPPAHGQAHDLRRPLGL
jgi:TRAP-type uncharacterized transport system substrate-binding protein